MKIYKYLLLFSIMLVFFACEKMEDNYSKYLDDTVTYSPKIDSLKAIPLLKKVILTWENPPGDVAKYLVIDYQDSVITTESMIDSIHLTNLEIKGYTISVITKDAFGHSSVPSVVTAFPNGEDSNNNKQTHK